MIKETRSLWRRLEINTVLSRQRKAGIITVPSSEIPQYEARLTQEGLSLKVLYSFEARGLYVSDVNSFHDGNGLRVCAIGKAAEMAEAVEAFQTNCTVELGRLLGYPPCCIKFFDAVWNRERYIDTSWPMAVRSASIKRLTDYESEGQIKPHTNMLLRWLGVRPVFHLPCCFDCEATVEVAKQIVRVAKEAGEEGAINLLYELLQWPVQWSALHGIAEIETPVLRISTRTDSTAKKYTIRLLSCEGAVAAAPNGNRFPFLPRASRKPTRGKIVALPPQTPKRSALEHKSWYHTDNGFRSNIDMERAYRPILEAIIAAGADSVLHLACKNGALLHGALQINSSLQVFGIDTDEAKIARAQLLLPAQASNLWSGNFHDATILKRIPNVHVCVLMIGRLLEISVDRARAVLDTLQKQSKVILVYAFDDWTRERAISDMAADLGLKLNAFSGSSSSVAQVVKSG